MTTAAGQFKRFLLMRPAMIHEQQPRSLSECRRGREQVSVSRKHVLGKFAETEHLITA